MTLTQSGSNVSGSLVPTTITLSGITSTFTGPVSGTVSGNNVSLTIQLTFVTQAFNDRLTCSGRDSWTGTISGNNMTGTFQPGSTPYVCDGGIPFPIQYPGGPLNFTRQ